MTKLKKIVFGKSVNIQKSSYFWNTFSGLINSFQSVFMLIIITRVMNPNVAGIYTIAYATASLFMNIGNYGMRGYQVTDVGDQYSLKDYVYTRVVTTIFMMFGSLVFVLYNYLHDGYSLYKSAVVLVMCCMKCVDAVEDVWHGQLQKKHRLDVAARILTIRLVAVIAIYGIALLVTRDLLISTIIAFAVSLILFVLSVCVTKWFVDDEREGTYRKAQKILHACFPLFVGAFLSIYITNAPKYAIDSQLTDEIQAFYGFIAMPMLIISVLSNFVFQPILTRVAEDWAANNISGFVNKVYKQFLVIFGITVASVLVGYLLGIPVLNFLFNTELSMYQMDMIILLAGGGVYAFSRFLVMMLTVMRLQRIVIWGYLVTAFVALLLFSNIVAKYSIRGAVLLFTGLMVLISLMFLVALVANVRNRKNGSRPGDIIV